MEENIDIEQGNERFLIRTEIGKFNWGAAVFGFVWGLFNGAFLRCISTYMVALVLTGFVLLSIPNKLASVIVCAMYFIYMGVRGSKWAWEEKKWENIERFSVVQGRWNLAALICFGIFFIIPMISFSIIYLISGEAIFKSFAELRMPDKDNSFIELFLTDVNVTSAANEDVIIDYLVKNKSDISENKYTRFNKNTVKVDSSIFSTKKAEIEDLYSFKKEAICKLPKKNCYIIKYKYEGGKITPVAKMYFDSVGRYKMVNVVVKK